MPKLKTRKSIAKRYKLTKKNKLMRKHAGQDHFNARESGDKTRGKRGYERVDKANRKTIKEFLPYHKQ